MPAIIHVPYDADLQGIASANHGAVLVLAPGVTYSLPAPLSLHGHVLFGRDSLLLASWAETENCLVSATDSILIGTALDCLGKAEIALMSAGDAILHGCQFWGYQLKGTQCHSDGREDARLLVTNCACRSCHIRSDWSAIGFQADGRDKRFAEVRFDNLRVGAQVGGKELRFAIKLAQVSRASGDVYCGHQDVVFGEGIGTLAGLRLHGLRWSSSLNGAPRGQPGLWFYPDPRAVELGRNLWPETGLDGMRFFPESEEGES
jgi:hypothetical protein